MAEIVSVPIMSKRDRKRGKSLLKKIGIKTYGYGKFEVIIIRRPNVRPLNPNDPIDQCFSRVLYESL